MQTKRIIGRVTAAAYTFTEVMVAVVIIGLMTVSLYAGISASFGVIQRTRENLRATQILVQRVETIRLYKWDQLTYTGTPGWLQTNFTEIYDPLSNTNGNGGGITYHGTVELGLPPASAIPSTVSYRTNLMLITVTLRWTNSAGATTLPHMRTYETLVAKNGMQNYVFGSQ